MWEYMPKRVIDYEVPPPLSQSVLQSKYFKVYPKVAKMGKYKFVRIPTSVQHYFDYGEKVILAKRIR